MSCTCTLLHVHRIVPNDETNEFLSVPSSVSVMHVHCVTDSVARVRSSIYLNHANFILFANETRKRDGDGTSLTTLAGQLRGELNIDGHGILDLLINREER